MKDFFPRQKLPYVRDLNYFSPSSFMQLESNPGKFYLRKLGPKEFVPPYDPQTVSMAVGSAFDSSVKTRIADRFMLACPEYDTLIANTVNVPNEIDSEGFNPWEHSVKLGHQLTEAYDELGCIDCEVWTGVEEHTDVGRVPGTEIPIFGQLDATLEGDVAFDWKVANGALRAKSPSPNPGYVALYDTADPACVQGPHPKAELEMHEWGGWAAKWAVQLTVYTWLLRSMTQLRPFRVALDQLICHGEGRVRVAQYRTTITTDFQQELRKRFKKAWDAIQEETLVDYAESIAELQVPQSGGWW